jgi:nicotinate-nucleotide pyrophosphorylase (carboxylating)
MPDLNPELVRRVVRAALDEDGAFQDVTTLTTVPPEQHGRGVFLAREAGVLAGLPLVAAAFEAVDPSVQVHASLVDGASIEPGTNIAHVEGPLAPILSAERVALNFLQRLSGVATATRRCAAALAAGGGRARLLDTRKTTPGFRMLEKAAVRAGGGRNHRFALGDGVLVKDNHVAACGGVAEAVRRARERAGAMLKIEVEVVDLPGLEAAIAAGADIVLLDNMDDAAMAEAVRRAAGRVLLEASGNMTLERLPRVAATGVDFVSMGAITHSAPAVDISFELG